MPYDHHHSDGQYCPACDFGPFTRNAYWTGKLMLARDFIDEQKYVIEKLRHHNQKLHGSGIACGLKVVQHPNKDCQDRFVCVEPGTAVDCCGHDIVAREQDCIDLWSIPELKKLKDAPVDDKSYTLKICIKYRECESEPIPKLYDECGCDDETCAPNRILESYELNVLVDAKEDPDKPGFPAKCGDLWISGSEHCLECDQPDCLVLATINNYHVGDPIVDQIGAPPNAVTIDNSTRTILPSVQLVKEVIDCILSKGPVGGVGKDGKGIDFVTITTLPPGSLATATLQEDVPVLGKRTLHLEIPAGKDGAGGAPGGAGLDDVDLKIVPCGTPKFAQINVIGGKRVLQLEIPTNCGAKFTHICGINWKHAQKIAPMEQLLVAFDGPINRDDINANTFIVQRGDRDDQTGMTCWCQMFGKLETGQLKKRCDVTSRVDLASPTPDLVRFIPRSPFEGGKQYRVIIKGDLIRDGNGKAIDANHLPPWAPFAPGPPGAPVYVTGDGIEGGTFESWFEVGG